MFGLFKLKLIDDEEEDEETDDELGGVKLAGGFLLPLLESDELGGGADVEVELVMMGGAMFGFTFSKKLKSFKSGNKI